MTDRHQFRAARAEEAQAVTEVIAAAFVADPVWGWAFPGRDALEVWWRFWIDAALAQQAVDVAEVVDAPGRLASVAVWIPPGGREIPEADEPHVDTLVRVVAGDRADAVAETVELFDATHPHEVPHHYLSLLGTAPAARGHGVAMALVGHHLAQVDERHEPAYLESSNPANLARYGAAGFAPVGEFTVPGSEAVVTRMWREPR